MVHHFFQFLCCQKCQMLVGHNNYLERLGCSASFLTEFPSLSSVRVENGGVMWTQQLLPRTSKNQAKLCMLKWYECTHSASQTHMRYARRLRSCRFGDSNEASPLPGGLPERGVVNTSTFPVPWTCGIWRSGGTIWIHREFSILFSHGRICRCQTKHGHSKHLDELNVWRQNDTVLVYLIGCLLPPVGSVSGLPDGLPLVHEGIWGPSDGLLDPDDHWGYINQPVK